MFRFSPHLAPPHIDHRGFTLIELTIAMAIFAVMSVVVMSVYINTTNTARKLSAVRQLTETAREITERISQDVREKGIADTTVYDPNYDLWKTYDYTASGSEYMIIKNGPVYVYGARTDSGLKPCTDTVTENTKSDTNIHCGLYLDRGGDYYNLVDSFIPLEDKKRVKIEDLKFYISGGGYTTRKVTLVMRLGLMPRIGVPASMVTTTKLQIQTTISERGWQPN